jgi:3'-phosphoadenosine 5'-phosphosulfate sulfotransferase (PAPS reductase)/FAD synthetase
MPSTASPGDLRRCARCVLPETYPGITYDENGVCRLCLDEQNRQWKPRGEEALRKLLEQFPHGAGEYDCLVALSGGRDSSFALHYAVRILERKVLAFTIDNGLIPQQTWENIASAVRILGVDHIVIRHDLLTKSIRPVLRAWRKRPSARMVAMMCLGCRLGMHREFRKLSKARGIPLCLSGGGEPEKSFATALFTNRTGRLQRTVDMLGGMCAEMLRNPRYLVPPTIPWRMAMEFLHEYPPTRFIHRRLAPAWRYVPLFYYLPYDEARIMSLITNELGWKKYHHSAAAWRSDCKIHLLKQALYQQTLGFTKNDELISGLIRRGEMTRDEGLTRLSHDNLIPDAFLRELFSEIGLDHEA